MSAKLHCVKIFVRLTKYHLLVKLRSTLKCIFLPSSQIGRESSDFLDESFRELKEANENRGSRFRPLMTIIICLKGE